MKQLVATQQNQFLTLTNAAIPADGIFTFELIKTFALADGTLIPSGTQTAVTTAGVLSIYLDVPDDPSLAVRYKVTMPNGQKAKFYLSYTGVTAAQLADLLLESAGITITPLQAAMAAYTLLSRFDGTTITIDPLTGIISAAAGSSDHAALTNLSYATAGHTGFSSAADLAAEIATASAAESALLANINTRALSSALASYLLTSTATGTYATIVSLASEISRASAAEAANAADILLRATTTALTAETNRATAAEDANTAALAGEALTRNNSDAAEVAARVAADLLLQPISTITETIDDRVAALLTAGSNITLTYNDAAGTLTIAASGGATALTWVSLTAYLNTGWVANGGGFAPIEYAIDGTFIRIRGAVARTSGSSSTIFTGLPAALTPAYRQYIATASSGGFAQLDVTTAGTINLWTGGVSALMLTYGYWQ